LPLTKLRQHLAQGEYVQARREAERLIQVGELVGEHLVLAYRGASLAHYHLQEVFAAIKLGERALELAQCLGSWELIGKSRYSLGEFYLTLGDYPMAYEFVMGFLSDLDRYPTLDKSLEAWAHHKLGLIFRFRTQYQKSLASHHVAAGLHQRNGDVHAVVEALRGVVWCHLKMGEPHEAWPYIQQVSKLLQEHPHDRLLANLLNDMAYYYQQIGDLKTSMNYCAEALVPGRPGVNDQILATACVIAGENALALNRREEARIFANLADEFALRAKHPTLMNRAVSLRRSLYELDSASA
jgi:tetratricopeptide (TPR) repeat protein